MERVSEYCDWLIAHGASCRTVEERSRFLRQRLTEWNSLDQSPAFLARWLNRHTGWTRITYLGHLRSIYAWAVETGIAEAHPLTGYKRPATPRPKPSPLTAAQLDQVFATAEGRMLTWLSLGYYAGLRAFEIAKFHGREINAETITLVGKGDREWTLPTHPSLWALAQLYPRDGYWFPSPHPGCDHVSRGLVSARVGSHFRACGIERGSTHRLRHSYITGLSRAHVETRIIQELARHQSLVTTQLYIDADDERLNAGIRALPVIGTAA